MTTQRLRVKIGDYTILFFMLLLAFITILPFFHIIALSLSSKAAAEGGMVSFWPVKTTLSSYQFILRDSAFFRSFWVSVKRVVVGGGVNLILTILMAYPLSKSPKRFPGRNLVMWFILVAMLFNAGLIPWYVIIRRLNLIDSFWALILPSAIPIWNVIILMNFFRNISSELEDAARIDGADPWTMMIKIFLPISMPALATVTLFSVVGHWNSWFDGLILMNHTSNYPIQTYIQQLVISNRLDLQTVDKSMMAEISNITLNSAKMIISTIPILILYPILQKYFVHGITLGSVKE